MKVNKHKAVHQAIQQFKIECMKVQYIMNNANKLRHSNANFNQSAFLKIT